MNIVISRNYKQTENNHYLKKKSCKTKKTMLYRNRNGYKKDGKWKELKKATHE